MVVVGTPTMETPYCTMICDVNVLVGIVPGVNNDEYRYVDLTDCVYRTYKW